MHKQSLACDVLVIGGGPAGIAAACCAAESAQRAILLDDNPALGGQIWRGKANSQATRWIDRARQAGVQIVGGAQVFAVSAREDRRTVLAQTETPEGLCTVQCERAILATGARERFLPFPGWTLRGVTGAGGLQALVKGGWPIAGKRVVVAGSGPLLPAVAAFLKTHGADVQLVAEQAPWSRLVNFGMGLALRPAVAMQALSLFPQLVGVPYHAGCHVTATHGARGALTAVTVRQGERTWQVDCDYLACGFNLVPNLELPVLLGCAVQDGFAAVNEWQESSQPGVYCAGELTGIGGLERSLIEGQIAGYAAAGEKGRQRARALFARRRDLYTYAARLNHAFALGDALKTLASADTIVCRCEDARRAQLDEIAPGSWRAAKLHTRCGMGACQGRVCGPSLSFLYGWPIEATVSARPPLFPVRLETLAATGQQEPNQHETTGEKR